MQKFLGAFDASAEERLALPTQRSSWKAGAAGGSDSSVLAAGL